MCQLCQQVVWAQSWGGVCSSHASPNSRLRVQPESILSSAAQEGTLAHGHDHIHAGLGQPLGHLRSYICSQEGRHKT